MRVPRVRFTVRRVLLTVAWMAVLLAVIVPLLRRRDYCLRMTARHAQNETQARSDSQSARAIGEALLALEAAHLHTEVRSKYQRVASRPWEALPEDPFVTRWKR